MNRIDCDQHKSYDKINCIRKAILVELDSTAVKQNNIIHLLLQRGLKQNLEIKTIQRFVWGVCLRIIMITFHHRAELCVCVRACVYDFVTVCIQMKPNAVNIIDSSSKVNCP